MVTDCDESVADRPDAADDKLDPLSYRLGPATSSPLTEGKFRELSSKVSSSAHPVH